ncbi:MAG: hypothetical protein GTN76_02915 [Candidatus Aenigmarchaeota archaeon]|nr:hypothetical protein [Candidatus Aenigmarchaeota archaeon]
MHVTIKVVVVLLILLIAFIVLVGLMIGWTGESQNVIGDIFNSLNKFLSELGGT